MGSAVVWILGAAVVLMSALPLTNSVTWWVRMWDFPRLHIGILALAVLLMALRLPIPLKAVLVASLLACVVYQAIQVYPYTPLAKKEVTLVPDGPDTVSLLSANVLMENTRHGDLIRIIEREDPDILLLMETDETWGAALRDVLARYSTVKTHLADTHYGLIFATRLDPIDVSFLWPDDDATPMAKATLVAPNGIQFNFIGLHPRPPVPGNDTEVRDRQIKNAAKLTSSSERPTICMGDFNDVAWSWTTTRFKRYGDFLDPRVGRGMMSSFHASHWYMRVPIDQIFVTGSVGLVSFNRLENFGSDHFPMMATIRLEAPGDA